MTGYRIVALDREEQLAQFCSGPNLPQLEPATVRRQQPDLSWLVLDGEDQVVGRASGWWRQTPGYDNRRPGFIGHYGAAAAEVAGPLIAQAEAYLAGQGCRLAVSPIDGNTWQTYRFVTEPGDAPPFFSEPDHPPAWPAHFLAAGYTPLAHYCSRVTPLPEPALPGLAKIAARAETRGIRVRSLQLDQFEVELQQLYPLILAAFRHNFLYTPLSPADFMAQYLPLRPYLQPELCLIAERAGQPLGFLLALPDWWQRQRGQPLETIIIKTVAVHPDRQVGGLGTLLVARCQALAQVQGYRQAIHALMHEGNTSLKISQRFSSRLIRRYALLAKPL
jgi:GNAT superfamily N-acetyltransferase